MNAVDQAERDMLVALIMEHNLGTSDIPDLEHLRSKYNLKISDALLGSSIDSWDSKGFLIVSKTFSGTAASIKPSKYGAALSALLKLIDGTIFEVDWKRERILTDGNLDDKFPGLIGWTCMGLDKPEPVPAEAKMPDQMLPIHIHNNFSPVNNQAPVAAPVLEREDKSSSRASWANVFVVLLIGIGTILASLWIAGKI